MNDILVFDRKAIRQKRNRCAPNIKENGFLFDWCTNEINNRLADIKREFTQSLSIGTRGTTNTTYSIDLAENLKPDIQADEEFLPFAANSFDLIISNLNLHGTNDLPGTLIQIKNTLKPDGLFIATLLGGETLYELRQSLQQAEMELTGGITPRVSPVADLQQMGALMQRAQFTLPVIDSEKITVTYDNIFRLMGDLRAMGESNTLIERKKNLCGKALFAKTEEIYRQNFVEADGKIRATFEIIFLLGWAPHESQQKPLRPGTAKQRMADALQVKEEKLPC